MILLNNKLEGLSQASLFSQAYSNVNIQDLRETLAKNCSFYEQPSLLL